MKPNLMLVCVLSLSAAAPLASSANEIPFFHRHKANSAVATSDAKPKTKRSLFHRANPTREEAARAEATYGMPGPQSVGYWHPQPGPAGVGAK